MRLKGGPVRPNVSTGWANLGFGAQVLGFDLLGQTVNLRSGVQKEYRFDDFKTVKEQLSVVFDLQTALGGSNHVRKDYNLGHTIELESITFPDGTTPESHGIDIIFASGRTSPNLTNQTVPEPGSFLIWSALGAVGLAASRRRKRKTA